MTPIHTEILTGSFIYVGIYWNNHHHMLHASSVVDGCVLWANLHLLFWLSLVPFATGWMGENHFSPVPVAFYGAMLFMAAVAYRVLERALISRNPHNTTLAQSVGKDRKSLISPALYLLAIPLSFVHVWAAFAMYVLVAVVWLISPLPITRNLMLSAAASMRVCVSSLATASLNWLVSR